jgi:hypothetical protein
MRRGQAAEEAIMEYGWVLILVVVAAALLYQSGLFSSPVPYSAVGFTEVSVVSFGVNPVDPVTSQVGIALLNSDRPEVVVTNMSVYSVSSNTNCSVQLISVSDEGRVIASNFPFSLPTGRKRLVRFQVSGAQCTGTPSVSYYQFGVQLFGNDNYGLDASDSGVISGRYGILIPQGIPGPEGYGYFLMDAVISEAASSANMSDNTGLVYNVSDSVSISSSLGNASSSNMSDGTFVIEVGEVAIR